MTQKLRNIILFFTFVIVFLSHVLESEGNKTRAKTRAPKIKDTTARNFPLCVTYHIFEEYKANLVHGVKFRPFLKMANLHWNRPTHGQRGKENVGSDINEGSEKGLIKSINYYRILADCVNPKKFDLCRPMRQWVHIHIQTQQAVKGLIVQSITEPFSIPAGRFDIEFACTDCKNTSSDINTADAINGDALDLKGEAAVIPCDRRTYIHVRHPNVYAYASDKGRSDFHFNFNWMDVTCRHMSKIQFMIFATTGWEEKSAKTDYFFSAAVDHVGVDSIDGMPYPWHPIWANTMQCHNEDKQLPDPPPNANPLTQRPFKLDWNVAEDGNERTLDYDAAYDLCIRAYDPNTKLPLYAQDPNDNTNKTFFISTRMCSNIPQTKCNYSLGINDPNVGSAAPANPGSKQNDTTAAEECLGKCACDDTRDENYITKLLEHNLMRRDYVLQRIHGMAAILGLIAINVVNIHISRYFKEAGGCCMLVGWWLWAHLAASYISLGVVWLSLALVTSAERPAIMVKDGHLDNMYSARECLLKFHKGIGFVAVIFFHIDFIFGAFRPISAVLRCICICVHASSGYLVVVIAAVAVFFSTACFDLVIFTFVMIGFSLIPWIVGFALQFLMDKKKKLNPKRKIFPVIEAVQVQPQFPMKIPRFILLGLLVLVTVILFFLVCFRGGRFKGWFVTNPCVNCEYKLDEKVLQPAIEGSVNPCKKPKKTFMSKLYECPADTATVASQEKKFQKWIDFCEKIKKGDTIFSKGGDSPYDE